MRYSTEELISRIRSAAAAAGQDPDIAMEQLRRESGFRPYYVYGPGTSPDGAKGLAQFLDGTWARFGRGGNPFDSDDAIAAYIRYMDFLLNRFDWDYRLALAGYHAGEGAAYKVLNNPAGNPKSAAYWQEILIRAGRRDLIAQPRPTPPPVKQKQRP